MTGTDIYHTLVVFGSFVFLGSLQIALLKRRGKLGDLSGWVVFVSLLLYCIW